MIASRAVLFGVVLAAGTGWFVVSSRLMGRAPGQALNESIGAALGLLVLISIIGTFRQRRGTNLGE